MVQKTSEIYNVNENFRNKAKNGFVRPTVGEHFASRKAFSSVEKYLDKYTQDEYTQLLLHMNGQNNGTVFTDSSSDNNNIILVGNPVTKTGIRKFGQSSGYFDGSDSYLSVNGITALGTNIFTVDMWIYADEYGFYTNLYASDFGTLSEGLRISTGYLSGKIQVATAGAGIANASVGFTLHTWNHIAVTRVGNLFTIYLNGINVGSGSQSINIEETTAYIGNYGNAYYFNGYIDEFRISKGIARWTENFTI